MNKIGISANPGIRDLGSHLDAIKNILEDHGKEVVLETSIAGFLNSSGMALEDMDKAGMDMLITVGGDGTVLRALQHVNVPILGVHMGRVGFLNEVNPENMNQSLAKVLKGDYVLDEHSRITMVLNGKPTAPVLNEIVVHSSQALKIRDFQIFLDDNLLDTLRADGVIAATPTGSTGYALSAGGPLLDIRLDGFLVMPLLPFRVSKRPNVVPMSSRLRIKINTTRDCIAVLDGQSEIKVTGEDRIEVIKAKEPARFLRLEKNPYGSRQRTFEKLLSY